MERSEGGSLTSGSRGYSQIDVRYARVESTLRYIYGLPEWRVPSDTSAVCPSKKAEKRLTMLRKYATHNWPQPQEWQWFESVDRMWSQDTINMYNKRSIVNGHCLGKAATKTAGAWALVRLVICL